MKLKIRRHKEVIEADVVGVRMTCLLVTYERGGEMVDEIVSAGQAVDQRAFWDAWGASGGSGQGLCWADGESFSP